ncbi:hypothetical protein HS088_TW15G01083 [Tripterygium wilfordii]|uniref:Calmodulin-binding domain-containing protein n=1 Tax=Tripterygium wilfordii TaxID=458696 RepID=A0A7J7CNA6_TRIWF|nr:serine/arginine repetitive matrix protein 1-like [Tripterygium wilfordii]XP_038726188.1 serine/arginine repetitive matrix protein 1-like [Tripterygium wilfordii]KAF5735575.1 hypothetical protein HS088_TW15G01083 [Tripterygium wilfordii]
MARKSSSLLVTEDIAKPEGGNSRRNSMGKVSSSNSRDKIPPHYLRASTGSCHDFCKFGREHAFEAKARRPFPKRMPNKPPESQQSVESEIQPERKKTSMVLRQSSPNPNSKNSISDPPESQQPVESQIQPERKKTSMVLRQSSPGPNPKNSLSDPPIIIKKEVSAKSVDSKTLIESEFRSENKKTSAVKPRYSLDSKTTLSPNFKRQEELSPSMNTDASSKQASLKAKEESWSSRHASKPKPSFSKSSRGGLNGGINNEVRMGESGGTAKMDLKKVPASPRPLVNAKPSVKAKASPKPLVKAKPSIKALASPRPLVHPKPSVKVLGSPRPLVHTKPSVKVLGSPRPLVLPKPSVRVLGSPRGSSFARPSLSKVASLNSQKNRTLKAISPLKNEKKTRKTEPEELNNKLDQIKDEVVQEKTLYVIGVETESEPLESVQDESHAFEPSPPTLSSSSKSPSIPESPSSLSNSEELEEESEYTVTEADDVSLSDSSEPVDMKEYETVEPEYKEMQQKGGMVSSEVNHQPVTLHFRRGKVVEFHSENNGPRRLKFRRGRVLGDNQNMKADGRRSFKKRGVDGDKNDGKPDSEQVVLRHQDVQGKKDAQGLFNNVIEETANKLVETRKSKVKALVGAFETVISLQDRKPSAAPVS